MGKNAWPPYICRHGCVTGKYTTRKNHTKVHPGPNRHIFHFLISKDVHEIISSSFQAFVQAVSLYIWWIMIANRSVVVPFAFSCVAGGILRLSASVFSGGEAGSGEAAWRFAGSRAEFHSRLRRSRIFAWVARKKKRRLNPPEDVRLKQNFSQLLGSFVKYCFYNLSIKFISFRRPV